MKAEIARELAKANRMAAIADARREKAFEAAVPFCKHRKAEHDPQGFEGETHYKCIHSEHKHRGYVFNFCASRYCPFGLGE